MQNWGLFNLLHLVARLRYDFGTVRVLFVVCIKAQCRFAPQSTLTSLMRTNRAFAAFAGMVAGGQLISFCNQVEMSPGLQSRNVTKSTDAFMDWQPGDLQYCGTERPCGFWPAPLGVRVYKL